MLLQTTSQDDSLFPTADRPEVQPPGTASQTFTSGRSEVQPLDPNGKPAMVFRKCSTSLASAGVPVEELVPDADQFSDRASSHADEGEVSDLESSGPDWEELLNVDQELSAEQTYRETMRGVRSFMTWNDILEFASSSQDDNPFTGPRTSHSGKVSVKVPMDKWLCRKFAKLNLTVQEDYPSHTSETAGLTRDQSVEPPKTLKWYSMHSEKKDFSCSKVYTWTSEPSRLNSSFSKNCLLFSAFSIRLPASFTGHIEKVRAGCM